ncbi:MULTISPECIES: glycogen debranching protein GlgX [Marinomonas]|uniref:Glycogen debranching protein GlgX n=1 Tax=Marinomonas arctica TaxID=383750 RepID=A0A7H1J2X2_9GAMM|nr:MULTISPECIES: glycogen debranching protein GlgX [Marinomonas]MCS7486551.1 glycogen debranching protein [Marinomonas sp. BSi20414]QNT04838.1 glycogen debranching protein GlgX [Marinomonas arctica]GGN31202.1 glycogen operon protein GlgX homolog [Marinomonas arctica]
MNQAHQTSNGACFPLGATVTDDGVNFAVVAEDASQLYLCLFDQDGKEQEPLPFINKHKGIWYMEVLGLKEGQYYGLRAKGEFNPEQQQLYNEHKLLIDPYARDLSHKLVWHEDQSAINQEGQLNSVNSAYCVPKSIVRTVTAKHNRPARVKVTPSSRALYELHVKGFSKSLPIDDEIKGTYLGVISAAGIEHLKSLNITTIQLMPCFSFMTERHLELLELNNYWGYNPISFFAPEPSYAKQDAVLEFQQMVDGLRTAGFEVILDVVYNHTAESELDHSSVCFRGLDNARYYRHQAGQYLNYTGCGNCIDTYHPNSIRLICDSMRYWVEVMGVDGFRFDLGVDLGRTDHDFTPKAPLLQAILQDPILSETCLVMEPWDIGPNGYQVGQFPRGFLECNDQYRDTVRRFWRGDKGMVPEFATRLLGSRDLFHKGQKSALTSVNYITYHDGYTMKDLVSYHQRHNLANMEDNRDGHSDNLSQNFGTEGDTDDINIQQQRLNQQLCFMATLLLSQGTPHILGGDELSHTQQGNNNAYCQDNDMTWQIWQDIDEETRLARDAMQHTISTLMTLRKTYPILAEIRLEDDPLYQHTSSDHIHWLNQHSEPMSAENWADKERHFIALTLTSADLSSYFWIVFYSSDTPIRVPFPAESDALEVVYQTPGFSIKDNTLHCAYRGVFVAKR